MASNNFSPEHTSLEMGLEGSDEISFILKLIQSCLLGIEPAEENEKVLLCGQLQDLEPCLVGLCQINDADVSLMKNIIVATNNISKLQTKFDAISMPQFVEWNEEVYEELLIERVKNPKDNFTIMLAVDFVPTLRRIERIRNLLDKNGTLVITSENPRWRAIKPKLMSSFSAHGGALIKLTECLPGEASIDRQVEIIKPTPSRGIYRGPIASIEDTCNYGSKCR